MLRIRPEVHMSIKRAHSDRSLIKSSSLHWLCFSFIRAESSSSRVDWEKDVSGNWLLVLLTWHWGTESLVSFFNTVCGEAGGQQCLSCISCEGRTSQPFFLHCSSFVRHVSAWCLWNLSGLVGGVALTKAVVVWWFSLLLWKSLDWFRVLESSPNCNTSQRIKSQKSAGQTLSSTCH